MKAEKGSLKRKIILLLISLIVGVSIVLLLMKFVFPDIDTNKAFQENYKLEQEEDLNFDENFSTIYTFFVNKCTAENIENKRIMRGYSTFKQHLDVFNEWLSEDLTKLQNGNTLKADFKALSTAIKEMKDSRSDLTRYMNEQVMPYVNNEDRVTSAIDNYYTTMATKTLDYLIKYSAVNDSLASICRKHAETTLENSITKIQTRAVIASWSNVIVTKYANEKTEGAIEVQTIQVQKLLEMTTTAKNTYDFGNRFETEAQYIVVSEFAGRESFLSVAFSTEEFVYVNALSENKKTEVDLFKTIVLSEFIGG